MQPQNILLGSGVPEKKLVTGHIEPTHLKTPAWRFHKDFPEGKLCKTDKELDQLDAEGWLDHPGKVRLLPGHEKVWEKQKLLETGKTDEVQEIISIETVKSEDAIRADILKAESDKVEANRLETERKIEEKRLKDERKEEEKRLKDEQKAEVKKLEPEQKSEETILKEYEEAKSPPGPRLCTLCGLTFTSLLGLNKHLERVHKGKKRNKL